MININLLPEDLRENIIYSKRNKKMINYAKVVIILCLFVLASFVIFGVSLINSNNFFLKNIEESNQIVDKYQPVIQKKKKFEDKATSAQKIRDSYKYWSKFDYILWENTPTGLYLATVESQGDNLKVTGYSLNKSSIGMLRDALEKSGAFSQVNIESIKETVDPIAIGRTVNTFNMSMKMTSEATGKK